MRTTTTLITFFCFLLLGRAAQAQLLLTNGDFDQDLSGWELPSTPDTTATWQADGNPAGSLRIESSWAGPPPMTAINVIDVRSACFAIVEGTYQLEGDVRTELGSGMDECHLDLALFDELDCSGGETSRVQILANEQGTWERLGGPIFLTPGKRVAFRVALSLWKYPFPVTTTCSFDNVVLRGPNPLPHEIPTLDSLALVALTLSLAIAAMAILRAHPRGQARRGPAAGAR